jgi:DNA-binding CsgD family transcriptional regulator
MYASLRPSRCEPPPPDPHLEQRSDELLRASVRERGPGDHPFHGERWLRELRRREEKSGATPRPEAAGPSPLVALLNLLLAETPLTDRQRQVLDLAREGRTLAEMAASLGCSITTASRWLKRATARVRRRMVTTMEQSHSEALIATAYREQVSAVLHHAERHCAPGREDCRRDGVCRHRWYLYHGDRGV